MVYFKFVNKCRKVKLYMELGTKNSNDTPNKKDSLMNRLIWLSLEIATVVGIWKYLIIPLLL